MLSYIEVIKYLEDLTFKEEFKGLVSQDLSGPSSRFQAILDGASTFTPNKPLDVSAFILHILGFCLFKINMKAHEFIRLGHSVAGRNVQLHGVFQQLSKLHKEAKLALAPTASHWAKRTVVSVFIFHIHYTYLSLLGSLLVSDK